MGGTIVSHETVTCSRNDDHHPTRKFTALKDTVGQNTSLAIRIEFDYI